MTGVGATALALVWGWLTAAVLPSAPRGWSLAATGVAAALVTVEVFLVAGAAAAAAAVGGIGAGAAAQRLWLGALRVRAAARGEPTG